MHAQGRGNSAYLLWRGGKPALVVDMGGDTPTELARAGVEPGQVPILAISHVHPDHVSGIPDYVWGEITAGRSAPLNVIGPPSAPGFHDARTLFEKLFGAEGALPELSEVMRGKPFPIRFETAAGDGGKVYDEGGLTIFAQRVNHGDVPALAYKVGIDGKVIVFAGDQTMNQPAFVAFAKGADLMVAHAIANGRVAGTALGQTVASPTSIGDAAREAGVKSLILSHWLGAPSGDKEARLWSLADSDGVVAGVKRAFGGQVIVARDLGRYGVPGCTA